MSALSHGVKVKFIGFLKSLFARPAEEEGNDHDVAVADPAPAPTAVSQPPASGREQNGNGLHLPLRPILDSLPLELRAKIKATDVGETTISVPLETILSQLALGAVKITFGQVRQVAPQIFAGGSERDQVPVTLPLGEILARLNPVLLTRRPAQKHVEVPVEINSPFDANGQGLVFSMGAARPEPQEPVRTRVTSPTPSARIAPARASLSSGPALPPPTGIPVLRPALPAPPGLRTRPSPPAPPAVPTAARTQASSPAPSVVPSSSAPVPSAPAAVTPLAAESAGEPVRLSVGLTALADGWPEALRQEIVQLNLVEAKVALPAQLVENALKRGRVAFTWRLLRSWIRPAPLPAVSAHDSALLELPLKVVAPLFLARQSAEQKTQQKVAIDADIPDLFFGLPKPEVSSSGAAAGPVAKPTDTNFYIWDDTSEVAKVDETEFKRKPSPGTAFVSRYATPNEIVSRAAALEGVVGALIALPDGLMVANQLPTDVNADTLAAFLPQIFGKVSQCTKELRMGELNNLNFTVGNVPWKIFRVHSIFFAAFGRAGQPLPTGQLAALAVELDRKKSN